MGTSSTRDRRDHLAIGRSSRKDRRIPPHVLDEALFKGVLIRERRRADRSNQPLVLMLVTMNDRPASGCGSLWEAAMDAVAAAKRETDVLGWFETRAMIGVILTEIRATHTSMAGQLESRVRRELARRLDRDMVDRFSIRLYVHPEPKTAGEQGLWPADPFLTTVQPRDDQAVIRDAMKRGLDVGGSLTLLLLLSPLFLLIAALVKLKSPGPVFFRQVRVGQKAKAFTMLKFRTMHVNANHAIHQAFVTRFINSDGQLPEATPKGFFKITNDSRVTAVGRVLRKTSLDELPQLWNVLRGDMSLVGPRPPLSYEVQQYKPWHFRRVLEAKPGITGLWQVTGRSRTTFDDMVRLDLRYARTCSFWTDLKILLATPAAVIAGKGAC